MSRFSERVKRSVEIDLPRIVYFMEPEWLGLFQAMLNDLGSRLHFHVDEVEINREIGYYGVVYAGRRPSQKVIDEAIVKELGESALMPKRN